MALATNGGRSTQKGQRFCTHDAALLHDEVVSNKCGPESGLNFTITLRSADAQRLVEDRSALTLDQVAPTTLQWDNPLDA